jgi:hypothetical protein
MHFRISSYSVCERDRAMKTFTLDEAQSLLPVLESLLKRAIEVRGSAQSVESGLHDLARRMGEPSIEYWHTVEAGFQGRQPLDERFRRRAASGGRPN